MRLELTGRHLTITQGVRKLVEQRLAHVLRLLNDNAVSTQVVLTQEKQRVRAEVTLHARGEHFLHGEGSGRDIQAALGGAVDKIDRQARTLKNKWTDGKRGRMSAAKAASTEAPPPTGAGRATSGRRTAAATSADLRIEGAFSPRVIRSRRYAVKPMSIEDAAAMIGDGNEGVIVFRNSATDGVAVMFRRPDGNIGLIEPEA